MPHSLAAIGFTLLGLHLLAACHNPKTQAQIVEAGSYTAEMEICMQKSANCSEYVECSNATSQKYNVQVTPDTCDAGKDLDQ